MISLIWGTQISQTHRQKIEWWWENRMRWGDGEFLFNGYKVSVFQDEKSSEDGKWFMVAKQCESTSYNSTVYLKKCLILLASAAHILKKCLWCLIFVLCVFYSNKKF